MSGKTTPAKTATKKPAWMKKPHGNAGPLRGSKHYRAKFNEQQVREIRQAYKHEGWSISELAKEFKVGYHTIYQIVKGKAWAHVVVD